jgi:large-conductance mechanosensitive channel
MTEPTGGPPSPQPPQAPPPQAPAPAPAPAPAGGNWNAPPPQSAPGGFQTNAVAVEAGPAPGIAYADLVTRIIALIIDGFIVGLITFVIGFIFNVIGAAAGFGLVTFLVGGVISAVISAIYFVYGWTRMRASLGQKFLALETVSAADGATLTQDQAIRRWLFLYGPYALVNIIPIVGFFLSFLALLYGLYLLYTASQSPKRQGFHDVQANTVVIKRVGA